LTLWPRPHLATHTFRLSATSPIRWLHQCLPWEFFYLFSIGVFRFDYDSYCLLSLLYQLAKLLLSTRQASVGLHLIRILFVLLRLFCQKGSDRQTEKR
jgi:hypothetical protein